MTDKNPKPLVAEYNSGEYLSVPRQSLRLKDVLARAIRGAMLDCQDMTDSFEPTETDDDSYDDDARWSYDDHVDAYNHQQDMIDRAHDRRKVAAAKAAQLAAVGSHSATNGRSNKDFDERRRSKETSEESGHEEPKSAGAISPRANKK